MLGEQTTQSHTTAPISKLYYGKVVRPRTETPLFGGAKVKVQWKLKVDLVVEQTSWVMEQEVFQKQ
jgi:hypothetical protein